MAVHRRPPGYLDYRNKLRSVIAARELIIHWYAYMRCGLLRGSEREHVPAVWGLLHRVPFSRDGIKYRASITPDRK